jgi:hypothetical protein
MIARQDVKEIIKAHNWSYGIIGDSKLNAIIVPAHITTKTGLNYCFQKLDRWW